MSLFCQSYTVGVTPTDERVLLTRMTKICNMCKEILYTRIYANSCGGSHTFLGEAMYAYRKQNNTERSNRQHFVSRMFSRVDELFLFINNFGKNVGFARIASPLGLLLLLLLLSGHHADSKYTDMVCLVYCA